MGCWYSRVDKDEHVSRCKARKKYMKQLVKARQTFSASHAMYLLSLRGTGSALVQFSTNETVLHRQCYFPPLPQRSFPSPLPPPPRPPPSPSTETWTSSIMASPLPPPPPPPASSSTWDFWDPFVPASSISMAEEEWEEDEETTMVSDLAMTRAESVMAPPSVVTSETTELSIVSRNSKDLGEIAKDVDDYFLKAAEAGAELSAILEVSSSGFWTDSKGINKVYNYGCTLNPTSWTWGSTPAPRTNTHQVTIGEVDKNNVASGRVINESHHCTVERLYAWEKKLFVEVKNLETVKKEHEKRVGQLRKMEAKRADYFKIPKVRKEVKKLESQMMVTSQAIDTISAEIVKVREKHLYPQLLELVKGMMCMWRSMYESHQVQMHVVQQLKYLNTMPSGEPTSEIHRQSTLQLELQVQQWEQSFSNLVQAQQDYIQALTGWLRLSLFQFNKSSLSKANQESGIYSLCEDWQLAVDRSPDKVASEGIKSFISVVRAIVAQQAEEHRQKKKALSVFKEYEKKVAELRSLETKYGPFSMPESSRKDLVGEKRSKVEMLKRKAEEEKNKHDKLVGVTRAMTMNNLQMGFPHVFQAMVGFSSVCMQSLESVYNQAKHIYQEQNVKRILL